ncbi:alpha-1,6-mannosylglycoprotein 6-beta-N-acetylglucosaminyltransferase B-like isoform X1 [Anarrhichthys ocellatus]|uniref:alpha-1,6-mannosylglycoprotein 6-beta-N-acetylglucosaminyltransferase B-like isoform X1 n=2 Tax=Anarrhichthys ocellatus TaxID=433405 RepID=UPI0012ECE8F1|nr:alpha-1,6-mannosylglycoprotein 6-beta-N-acetylglucosaminyltransferase B-like isoform X1 [Anarrhichthys ocellatus]XP_031699689.1 alpha-1,6-mannosylglycoprotein 6-beta-N-acetylglucosaminyltransferase B-like isoform X1 [Anarrhichthys ocellatus]
MHVALRPRSGCLVLCLCLSVFTLLLQSLWVPLEMTRDEPAGRSPEEQGQRGLGFRRLALRLEALSTRVQRLSRESGQVTQLTKDDLSLLLQSFRQDQQGLARLVERELKRVSQRLDQLSRHPHPRHQSHTPTHDLRPHAGPNEKCEVPMDRAYPVCAEKVEFLRARWQSDPCYAFYGVDGTTCSILTYLSQIEDFCPFRLGRNHSALPWHQKPHSYTEKAEIRTTMSPLYEVISNSSGPAVNFIRSRVERMSERWIQAALRMRQSSNKTVSAQMRVLLYPGALAGSVGQRFEALVDRGGPLGELVQWADLSACLTILGHNLTFSTSQQLLQSLIGAAPGRGSCPIQRPLTFDLIYTDYHGLAHLHGAMGLAFLHYQCRFRILDSFGTEPAFNLGSYARSHGYKTLWGSWGLQPLQYMTMFPHTPDNSFLGFVSEEAAREEVREEELEPDRYRKDRIAVIYGKQDYMWQGKSEYVEVISEEMETHATVYQPPGLASNLPGFIRNHGLLTQEQFLRLLRRAKVFVGLGFPYEGPAPIEAIALGCVFLQPRFHPPHLSDNNDFYKGKPTTRQISSQHPYAEEFIGKPHVWTVDVTNKTDVREAARAILRTEVKPFTPREFTCEGMLERVRGYIAHQNFCSTSVPTWPPESALRVHLGPLGQSCVSVCRRSSLVCEPALFHHLNSPAAFARLRIGCSSMGKEVNHLFPSYSPWGRLCGLQQEPLLFSCAGSDPSHRRLCPCRAHLPGQVALCPDCL